MKNLLIASLLLILTSSCAYIPGLEGYYGPFTLTVKAKDGEYVEDVIVTLSLVTVGFMGKKTHTYKATKVGNTGEMLTFPRGFVSKNKESTLSLDLSISHPSFFAKDFYVGFPRNPKGSIDIGEVVILSSVKIRENANQKSRAKWERQGLSENEIKRKLKIINTYLQPDRILRFAIERYFPSLHKIGRQDLIDKHFPRMVRHALDHLGIIDPKQRMLEENKYKKELEKWLQ